MSVTSPGHWLRPSLWRDLLVSAAIAAASALLAARFDFHERLFAYTRRWEAFQLDELPVAALVFSVCLVAFYARRHAELRRVLDENRRLAQRTLEVQEEERKHLARELHDELGQYLNAIKLDARGLAGDAHEPVEVAARRIEANADHVYGVVGGMISRLRPAALDELGLAAALESCIAGWRTLQPGRDFQLEIGPGLEDLGERLDLAIYRIVQEGLTNSVRHAGAGQVQVRLRRRDEAVASTVELTLGDDGAGISPAERRAAGRGLSGMRERVAMLGGQFELLSTPGRGVTIRVMLPLQPPRA